MKELKEIQEQKEFKNEVVAVETTISEILPFERVDFQTPSSMLSYGNEAKTEIANILEHTSALADDREELQVDEKLLSSILNFDETLDESEKERNKKELADSRKMVRGLYGGVPLAPLVAANVPDCMSRYERDNNATVRNVYYNIGCPWYTSTKQIVNKGLITLFIINALEERGEMINFRAFEASREGNEIVDIEVALKRPGEAMLDVGKCYFPLVRKEFLRRILFRTLESIPVRNGWADGYGVSLKQHELKKYLNAKDDDIILSYPEELDIHGQDLIEDAINALKTLKLTEEFDIEKIKRLHL